MEARELDELEALAAAAQAEPWAAVQEKKLDGWPVAFFGDDGAGVRIAVEVQGRRASEVGGEGAWADARFVARARSAVPALIAETRRLHLDLNRQADEGLERRALSAEAERDYFRVQAASRTKRERSSSGFDVGRTYNELVAGAVRDLKLEERIVQAIVARTCEWISNAEKPA